MKRLITILLFIPLLSFSQPKREFFENIIYSNLVFLKCDFVCNGKTKTIIARCININGKYIGTCYHIIIPIDSFKISKIIVVYLKTKTPTTLIYDSTEAYINFKAKKNQYDFSKHEYRDNDPSTDFVVLKLRRKIVEPQHEFSYEYPIFKDTVYSFANNAIDVGRYLFRLHHNSVNKDEYRELIFTGISTFGFSGAPLMNSKGQIVGIITRGAPKYPADYVNKLLNLGQITFEQYQFIKDAYSNKKYMAYATSIKFLIDKYMRGYLDDN